MFEHLIRRMEGKDDKLLPQWMVVRKFMIL